MIEVYLFERKSFDKIKKKRFWKIINGGLKEKLEKRLGEEEEEELLLSFGNEKYPAVSHYESADYLNDL